MSDSLRSIARYLDDGLDAGAAEELAAAIRSDPAVADAVSEMMMLDMHLRERTCCAQVVESISEGGAIAGRIGDGERADGVRKHGAGWRVYAAMLVAAVLFVSISAGIVRTITRPGPSPQPARIASVVYSQDVEWDSEPARIGEDIIGERVSIMAGELEMMLRSGAQVNLSGATELWMSDSMRVALRSGRARFVCPHSAVGFTVELANGAKIEDLGTDFELRVDDSGRARLFVHQGRVATTDAAGARVTLEAGYGHAFDPTGHPIDADSDPWLRRLSAIGAMRGDASLKALVDPASTDPKGVNLHGAAVLREGADDAALGFAGGGAYAELTGLSVEGSLTVAAWIKPGRVDQPFAAIVMTPSWLPGGVHVQLANDRLKLNLHDAVDLAADTAIVTDRWQHVAATVDASSRRARVYVDGRLAGEAMMPEPLKSRIDRATIGAWASNRPDTPEAIERSFTGEISELAIFGRALGAEEIAKVYQTTAPLTPFKTGESP